MATVTEDVVETSAGDKRGIRPNHIIIGLWTGVAVVTAISGIAAAVFEFHHEEGAQTREVFGNIPTPMKAMFYALIPTLLIYVGFQLSFRVKNWQRGAPENRKTTKKNVKQRLADMRAGLYMQTLMRDPIAGIMHSMIYFGFLILMAVTTTLEIDHQLPESLKFLDGGVYKGYALVGDAAGLMFFAGLMWALSRRLGPRSMQPYRIRIKNKPEHFVILGTLLAISISGFGAEAFRIALDGSPSYEKWSFIGYPLAQLVDGMDSLSGWHQASWIAHVISFALFLIILPTTMLRHMVTSPANMYLKDRDRPKGAMKPMANLMETEMESFGASVIEDFTWKQLMDTDSCTMCGRCTAVCPASATGKSLDPREIVLKTGEVMARSGTPQVTPPIGVDKEIALANEPGNILVAPNNVFDRITSEEIWACTTCKACDENCPVNIEILDKILDMRRYLSLMESDFPAELGNAYRAMENQGNPWGMGQGERADWASEFEGLEVLDGGDPMTAEYLYWVGCAGSFDDKNKKVSQAFSKLMDRAGVSFAILGPSEMCTGDPARRSGNEYIFQMLAMQNIETLNSMGVKKIVAQCPHCFNTLANEYPQLGGHYEVVHHSQLLEDLIDSGKLDVTNATLEDRLVYHDSCYLGRHNDVYLSPRNVVGSIGGIQVVEAERNGTKGMCCGAGGARMWMEEHVGKQINVERSQELLATGATRIATACPFCYVMIDDGIKGEGVEDGEVLVQDIAMHLLDAIEEGEAKAQATMVNVTLKPTAERVTAEKIELPLGFGMHGDLDGDGIRDTDAEPGPIAALVGETHLSHNDANVDEAGVDEAGVNEADEEE